MTPFSDSFPPSPARIVVVDDEPMVTASITTMLMLEPGYEAVAYNAPREALNAILAGQAPDVVISDFLMPDMDGIQFLHAVRERFPETTLILLTGYADKENAIRAINEAGIYRYIEKPWDNEALKLAIRNGVERTRLITRLNEKIVDLEQARSDLKEYSAHLESRVTEKTHDLTLALDKLRAIVEHTAEAIVTIDNDGRIQGLNPVFSRWTGRPLAVLEGQHIGTVMTFQEPQALAGLLDGTTDTSLTEARIGVTPLEVSFSPLPGREGTILVCRDIAKRKEAERLREDFVSTLTHDLRTPLLASIQSLAFFLDGSMGPLAEDQSKLLSMMKDSNQQMLSLVNDLLEVYRYEARQQVLVKAPFDLRTLAGEVVAELGSLAVVKNQALTLADISIPTTVTADRHAIRRVITNLVGNAIHYTPAGGRIEVLVAHRDNHISVAIKDTGRGIPAADLPRLFDRFAQGTSRHRTTGTGLGLYLSRQIIEAHGGQIAAESVEGQGSTFRIEFTTAN